MNTLDNKYSKWYWRLIETRRNNPKTNLTESHHIHPESLGGINTDDNLINLSKREHFIAHLLLSKMFVGKEKSKMQFALRQMLGKYIPNSRIYEKIKIEANEAMKGLWKDLEWKEKVISDRKERLASPEIRTRMSEIMDKVWTRPEYIEKHEAAMKVVRSNPEWLENNREHMRKAWQDPTKRNNILSNRKPHTEERRANQSRMTSEQNKKTWADPVVRARRSAAISKAKKEYYAKKKAAEAALLSPKVID